MLDWKDRVDISVYGEQEAKLLAQADRSVAIQAPQVTTAQITLAGQKNALLENLNVQYVGFEAKGLMREYKFVVRGAANHTNDYFLEIDNESFSSRHVRFQDAAEICSLRLHRELAASGNQPSNSHYRIGTAELEDYRKSHSPKAFGNPYKPKAPEER
jgi:hypothetical protein